MCDSYEFLFLFKKTKKEHYLTAIFLYSPFEMKVRPTVEPKNVKVTGPGVSSKGIPASIPADFVVDTTEAGYGDLQVQVLVSSLCLFFCCCFLR